MASGYEDEFAALELDADEEASLNDVLSPRLLGDDLQLWHGYLGSPAWRVPKVVARSTEEARPGYDSVDATEYLDSKAVLEAKADLLIKMLRQSNACVAYTGAGISTSAGVGDYASKAKNSLVKKEGSLNRLKAEPTLTHRVLTALEKKKHLHQWIQQNHDGLAQKAGFPQSKLNEIHGSWFDRKNPVVLMDDGLRTDLFERMVEWGDRADMCLALGSSLCGMNADQVATKCARKAIAGEGVGLVIVNLQATAKDDLAALRVFARLDDFFLIVAKRMKLKLFKGCLEQSAWKK